MGQNTTVYPGDKLYIHISANNSDRILTRELDVMNELEITVAQAINDVLANPGDEIAKTEIRSVFYDQDKRVLVNGNLATSHSQLGDYISLDIGIDKSRNPGPMERLLSIRLVYPERNQAGHHVPVLEPVLSR